MAGSTKPTPVLVGPAGLEPAASSTPTGTQRSARSLDLLGLRDLPGSSGALYGGRRPNLPLCAVSMAVMKYRVPPVSHWANGWSWGDSARYPERSDTLVRVDRQPVVSVGGDAMVSLAGFSLRVDVHRRAG